MKYKFIFLSISIFFISLYSSDFKDLNYVHKYILNQYSNNLDINNTKLNIRLLNKNNAYAFIQAIIVDKNNNTISTNYIDDITFSLCLKKNKNSWKIIYDLSRTDVPSNKQVKDMQNSFPKEFPKSLLSNFWQEILMDDETIYNLKLQHFNYGFISLEQFYKIHQAIYKQRIDKALENNHKAEAIKLQEDSINKLKSMMEGIIQRYKAGIADKEFLNQFRSYIQIEQFKYFSLTNKTYKNNILNEFDQMLENLNY